MITLRRRLLLLMLPALALVMLIGGLVDYLIALATTRSAYDQVLASAALAIAASVHADDSRLTYTPPPHLPGTVRMTPIDGLSYRITGPNGALIAGDPTLPQFVQRAAGSAIAFGDAVVEGQSFRIASLGFSTSLGIATVSVGETVERRTRSAWVMLSGKLLVDFVELDATLILIGVAIYYGLRPLRRLRDQVESQDLQSLQRFDEDQVPAELRPLITAFNRLLELLGDAAASQRRFVADAAHQLRTPVAGLLAQLELLMDRAEVTPVRAELDTLNRGIQQLSHSANQLLALARAEPLSTKPEEFQLIPMRRLIEGLIERNVDRADRLGLDLGAELQDCQVRGDPFLIEDLLGNLVDNALKYTPRGGHVTVRCGERDGYAFVEVRDSGPGIPESDRLRVRERFYRRPGAAGSGAGLGLAIVEEIARAHGAVFRIEGAAAGTGAVMQVRFVQIRGM